MAAGLALPAARACAPGRATASSCSCSALATTASLLSAAAQLVRRPAAPAKRGLLGSFESDVRDRARRLFRVADPDGAGTCDERRFATLAESCGLGRADVAAALAACGGGPFINEDAFVAALAPHIGAAAEGSRHHK